MFVCGGNSQTVKRGTYSVVLCDIFLYLELSVLRSTLLCLWKLQADSAVCDGQSAVLFDSTYFGISGQNVLHSAMLFLWKEQAASAFWYVLFCIV